MIHPTAIIDASAQIGDNVTIGPYCIIQADTVIGDNCELKSHVVVANHTTLGKGNTIYPFASIGEDPQDKKYANEPTRLVIGDNNTIREYATINRGTIDDEGITVVGDDNWIMAYVHIAHDCQIGNNTIFANNATLGGHVEVGDYAIFGGFSGAHQFCKIGSHSFLGIYSGVAKDLPPYVIVSGQPAMPRGVNIEGLRRRNFTVEQIRNIKTAYKLLYTSDLRLEEALEKISGLDEVSNELQVMLDFLQASTRGIIR